MPRFIMALVVVLVASVGTAQVEFPKMPTALDLESIRRVTVQHDGRWMPLDTLARDVISEVSGTQFLGGHDPVLVLLSWTFAARDWQDIPLIGVKSAGARKEIKLPEARTTFSYGELTAHEHLHFLIEKTRNRNRDKKMNPLESVVSEVEDKLIVLQGVFFGRTIRIVPDPKNALTAWGNTSWVARSGMAAVPEIAAAWVAVGKAFNAADPAAFASTSKTLLDELNKAPAAHRPTPSLIATELRYNALRPFRTAWQLMLVGTVLALAAMFVRKVWFDVIAVAAMVVGFGVLTYGLSLRWTIAGRIPAANMFESLLFLSWGMGAFAILAIIFFRHRSIPLTASFMGSLSLFLADSVGLDTFIRPIAPVLLDTVWMSIHVPIIMVSYSVLALGVLIAHALVVVMAVSPGNRLIAGSIDRLHFWYIHVGSVLLFIGIITGSMWAASSWGRYWGWDPKEVWSLVAFLGYMTIMHVKMPEDLPKWAYALAAALGIGVFAIVLSHMTPLTPFKLMAYGGTAAAAVFFVVGRGPLATAVKSIVAFWLIIMTYVGVNFVLGIGLHSYGFGKGAVAGRVFTIGTIDLCFVGLCGVIYLLRRTGGPAARGAPALS